MQRRRVERGLCAAFRCVKTLRRESAGVGRHADRPIIRRIVGRASRASSLCGENIMDLAMAMGVALFGLFVGSSAWFLHSVKR
jgi:hypothetical protein